MEIDATHIRHTVGATGAFSLEKVIYKGKTQITLSFMTNSDKFSGKGYTITLEDGNVLKNDIYPVGQHKNGTWFFLRDLDKKDIEMLSKSRVAKFTIGNLNEILYPKKARLLQGVLPCLVTK